MSQSFNFSALIKRIEAHNEPNLLKNARSLVPLDDLQLTTARLFRDRLRQAQEDGNVPDETTLYESIFITELLRWFKNDFFTWFNKPDCDLCGRPCKLVKLTYSVDNPDVDTIEMFTCSNCNRTKLFHRYNNSSILLRTRTGRCHEHAQAFALICKALNYDSRVIFDLKNDHIWNEIYSEIQQRWIHCDPCEILFDRPLTYEAGWKKVLNYVIAIGDTGIQEVTRRYVTEARWMTLPKHNFIDEELDRNIMEYQNKILFECSPERKKHLLKRYVMELSELLASTPQVDGSYEERQSGSWEWRHGRGEVTVQKLDVGYTIDVNLEEENRGPQYCSFWYCTNSDVYCFKNNDHINSDIRHGWQSCVHSYRNIMRKEEQDWKMTYLAREFSGSSGEIQWFFKGKPGVVITDVTVSTNFFVSENGKVKCKIISPDNSVSFSPVTKTLFRTRISPTNELYVKIELSGGTGNNAWQHAQFARQAMSENQDVSFGVILLCHRQ